MREKRWKAMIPSLMVILALLCMVCGGCSSSDGDAVATETQTAEYGFWTDLAQTATNKAKTLLGSGSRQQEEPDFLVLTNAGYAMIAGHATHACLDGLAEAAEVSVGKESLLSIHGKAQDPLWFFFVDQATGDAAYVQTDPAALDLSALTMGDPPFSVTATHNIKAQNLLDDLQTAHGAIFEPKAFNGNEFRLITLANLFLQNAPPELIEAARYHDHYCPGVTSGYYLVEYLKSHFPLTDAYSDYFVLSIPPYCKDDALITLLNATPGKSGYGVFHLLDSDKARLKESAKNIAGVFFRWNGNSGDPQGEGTILTFDFTEAKQASNWGADTPWNWWESRLKMDLFYLERIHEADRFITEIPFDGKARFSLADIPGISQPKELARPGVDPLEIFDLLASEAPSYSLWRSVGKQAMRKALSRISSRGASPEPNDLIVLTNAGYAEIDGQSTMGALDGLSQLSGASRGKNSLIEVQSAPEKPLWFAIHDPDSGLCAYLQTETLPGDDGSARFSLISTETIASDTLLADPYTYASVFAESVFGGNEFRVVTIANAVAQGAPTDAIRAFEFHDHYCPGVTSGIMMAKYAKTYLPLTGPNDSYFVQAVAPWCKEDALMVMLNATPGKRGYAVTYPTEEDTARWLPQAQDAATVIYRKNGDTGLWDGMVLGFSWAESTGCPETGNSVIDKLCTDLWYLERMDQPENFVTVIKEFALPQGTEPKDYARPGVDPMERLGLTVAE